MKKVFLTFGILIFSVSVCAQVAIKNDDLVGWWVSGPKTRCQLFFWKDANNDLNLQEISYKDGKGFIIRSYEFDSTSVYMRSSAPCCPDDIKDSQYTLLNNANQGLKIEKFYI